MYVNQRKFMIIAVNIITVTTYENIDLNIFKSNNFLIQNMYTLKIKKLSKQPNYLLFRNLNNIHI